MKRAALLVQCTYPSPRHLVYRIRVGQYGSGKILAEWDAATLTRDEAIAAARAWCEREGYRLIVNEAWLEPA